MRIYTSPLCALITSPRQWTEQVPQESKQRFLDPEGKQTEVCDRRGFIGRRRLLQKSLAALKLPIAHPNSVQGVLLHGMGGLGKSSTAARLADRLQASHKLIVWRGKIDESRIRQNLKTYLANLSNPGADIGQALMEIFQQQSLLLIFDDFEQNAEQSIETLEKPGTREKPEILNGEVQFTPDSLSLIHQVLDAIKETASNTRLIITSRYKVPINAAYQIYTDEPNRLRNSDLDKKCKNLRQLQKTSHLDTKVRQQAIKLADGIPRLLEWMDTTIEQHPKDTQALLDKLSQTQAEYREKILIQSLLEQQSQTSRQALAYTALFHIPVPYPVIQAILPDNNSNTPNSKGVETTFQSAHQAGLVEIIEGETPHYYVSSLLHPNLNSELSPEQTQTAIAQAAESLYQHQNGFSEHNYQEILRLALLAEQKDLAVEVGDKLAAYLLNKNRWQESLILCHQVLALQEDFRLLTSLAQAEQYLGISTCDKHFLKAIALFPAKADDDMLYEQSATEFNYANLLIQQGKLDQAMELLQKTIPLLKQLGKERDIAVTHGKIADILSSRGNLDEALRIRREEQLPVYEVLGDVRSKAVTMGHIADILRSRGELDEALRICREEQLPVYEALGDVREKAVTMGQIADILRSRGELDEALRIRREEQLPVYEALGDVHQKAVTMGQIADILHSRGELDEALRIRREEELPVYEALGDVRSKAVTMGKIADILSSRGELDEALRIRREEQLPVYEALGDVHQKAVTMGKIADILGSRGELDEALRIRRKEQLPVYEALGYVREKAVTMGKIADILDEQGQLEEALRVREEDEVSIYQELGDIRELLVVRVKIAISLWKIYQKERQDEVNELLCWSLQKAEQMQITEAEQIRGILQQLNMTCE